jgi:DNA-binding NtrC family response regulator
MEKQSLHILLVDDDELYAALMDKVLSDRGHRVSISFSGNDAIHRLENEQFDIVLLDYKMEGINGINVLQWMYGKKIKKPVIIITSFGSDEIFDESMKWMAVEYFIKGEKDTIRLPRLIEQVCSKIK